MKKLFLPVLFILLAASVVFAETSVAILPMESLGVRGLNAEEAQSSLYRHLAESGRFILTHSEQAGEVLEKNNIHLGVRIDPEDAAKIGTLLDVNKLIATRIYMKGTAHFAIDYRVIDAETGNTELSGEVSERGCSAAETGSFCASDILQAYPRIGHIEEEKDGLFEIDLGSRDGLKKGSLLFVARKQAPEKEEALPPVESRVGTLVVTEVSPDQAQAEIKSLVDPDNRPRKGDLVSPDPIPRLESEVSLSAPLLSGIRAGRPLLKDNMRSAQYLTAEESLGESYQKGRFYMNATHLTSGSSYCFYSHPYEQLENFVLEGVMRFEQNTKDNRFTVMFRVNGTYPEMESYSLFINDKGQYALLFTRLGRKAEITPLRNTHLLNRKGRMNRFRIVAWEDRFDIYINKRFLVGFRDERIARGAIGFLAGPGSYISLKKVEIWDAVAKKLKRPSKKKTSRFKR